MDNSAVRSDSNVIYGETYMVTLINSTKYLIQKILPQNLDRRPLIWQYPISVIFWKK